MVFGCSILLSTPGYAITIHYQATDLPDTVSGIDEWRYDYTLSDYNFAVDTGFVIYFDPLLYADLQDPAPVVNGDWDILIIQPMPFVPDHGTYDALSLQNNASLTDLFALDFVWSGTGTPGSQTFEVYDAALNVIDSGNTVGDAAKVPIPPASLLFGAGLIFIRINNRKSNVNQIESSIFIEEKTI